MSFQLTLFDGLWAKSFYVASALSPFVLSDVRACTFSCVLDNYKGPHTNSNVSTIILKQTPPSPRTTRIKFAIFFNGLIEKEPEEFFIPRIKISFSIVVFRHFFQSTEYQNSYLVKNLRHFSIDCRRDKYIILIYFRPW